MKKAGPKPSGLGLESSFILQRAFLISAKEKGAARELLWKEPRAFGASMGTKLEIGAMGED